MEQVVSYVQGSDRVQWPLTGLLRERSGTGAEMAGSIMPPPVCRQGLCYLTKFTAKLLLR